MTAPTLDRSVLWRTELDESVSALVPVPRASLLAAGTLGGDVVVLNTSHGALLDTPAFHEGGVLSLAVSPDGTRLASGGADGQLRLSALPGTDAAGSTGATAVGGWVHALAWSPDGTRLAVAAGRSLVLLGRSGELLHRWDDQPSTVTGVAWSRDSSRVAAAAYGGLRWYATVSRSCEPVRTFDWKGSLLVVRVSPDGRWVASGNQDSSVHVWRLWSGEDAEMTGYPEKVDALAFDRTSRWMACGGTCEISLWDFSGPGPMGRAPRMLPGHDDQVSALRWQPDGDLLASGGRDGGVAVWSPGSRGTRTRPLARVDAGARIRALAWTGPAVLFGTVDGLLGALEVPA